MLSGNNVLDQTKYNTVEYGFKSFKYQGGQSYGIVLTMNLNQQCKMLISKWAAPTCQCSMCTLCNLKGM